MDERIKMVAFSFLVVFEVVRPPWKSLFQIEFPFSISKEVPLLEMRVPFELYRAM